MYRGDVRPEEGNAFVANIKTKRAIQFVDPAKGIKCTWFPNVILDVHAKVRALASHTTAPCRSFSQPRGRHANHTICLSSEASPTSCSFSSTRSPVSKARETDAASAMCSEVPRIQLPWHLRV